MPLPNARRPHGNVQSWLHHTNGPGYRVRGLPGLEVSDLKDVLAPASYCACGVPVCTSQSRNCTAWGDRPSRGQEIEALQRAPSTFNSSCRASATRPQMPVGTLQRHRHPCTQSGPLTREALEGRKGEGGAWDPKFVYQKRPDKIFFPIVNLVLFPRWPLSFGGGVQGG